MIDQETVAKIHDAADIVEVVSEYVTLRKRGVNLIGLCPFHNEKTPSFTVSPAKGIFKCFGCGKGGNAVHFIMEHEQLSYPEALKQLARKYNIEVKEREWTDEEREAQNARESMFLVNDFAQQYFTHILHNHIDGKAVALAYFKERGFREDIIKKFHLGYSLEERDAFTQAALKKGYKKDYLIKTGLTAEYDGGRLVDRFRGRVIFPVHSISGKVVAFGGRTLRKDDKMAKYVNSPESEIYHKSRELYGIFYAKQAIVREDRCFLVEGYTDVLSMHQSGIENVVASSGTALTTGQIKMIHRFTENVTVIYDGDAAGIKASLRGIDLLLEEGLNIRVLLLPEGEDPDSFARKHNSADFIRYVEENSVDFMRFKTSILKEDAGNDPIKRARLILDIVKSIAVIPNSVIRAEYIKECSTILEVDEAVLYNEKNKLKRKPRLTNQQRDLRSQPTPSEEKQRTEETSKPQYPYVLEERNILKALILHGKKSFPSDEFDEDEGFDFKLFADFIYHEINMDSLSFHTPEHQTVLKEYEENYQLENFDAERYFLFHNNPKVVALTTDLITERYPLSKIHAKNQVVNAPEDKLKDYAKRLIYEYKNRLLIDIIKEKLSTLKLASEAGNKQSVNDIMLELSALEELRKNLAKKLGERIITRL